MTPQAGQAWFFNVMTFRQIKTWNCKRFETICFKNEYFTILKITILINPSFNLTKSDPWWLHKLDKLDFSMSCHSDTWKLETKKDLKPLARGIKDFNKIVFCLISRKIDATLHVSSSSITCQWRPARFKGGGILWRRRAAEIKGCDFLMLSVIPRLMAYSTLDHCAFWGHLRHFGEPMGHLLGTSETLWRTYGAGLGRH